jgi:predicted acylesterase/phospholipase RssA
VALLAVVPLGCSSARPFPPLDLPPAEHLVEVRGASTGQAHGEGDVQLASALPRHVLVISGGAANGAYTVGVLKGWSASGKRPAFDVVTGISTGGLIAPFAFVGPECDDTLQRLYTHLHSSDVYQFRFLPTLLWSDSVADSTPLRHLIEGDITPELLAKIARAHAAGRRLYVGTTDLDRKQLVVWDLGAIAASSDPGKLELFRKILLASASVPGVLPTVPIDVEVDGHHYTELHVDGGISSSLFLQPAMLGLGASRPAPASPDSRTVYTMVAGKLLLPPRPVERTLPAVAGEALRGLMQSQMEGDLLRIYLLARTAGYHFALNAVPEDFPADSDVLTFNPVIMQKLFDWGYREGLAGKCWRSLPPGVTPQEQVTPRGGVLFHAEGTVTRQAAAGPGLNRAGSGSPANVEQTVFDPVTEDRQK